MFDGDISVYFSNYVMCTQTIPMSLQSQLSSILQADTIQTNLLKDVQTAIHQMDSNDKDRASSRLKSSLLQLNETYDAKLSEVREVIGLYFYTDFGIISSSLKKTWNS